MTCNRRLEYRCDGIGCSTRALALVGSRGEDLFPEGGWRRIRATSASGISSNFDLCKNCFDRLVEFFEPGSGT